MDDLTCLFAENQVALDETGSLAAAAALLHELCPSLLLLADENGVIVAADPLDGGLDLHLAATLGPLLAAQLSGQPFCRSDFSTDLGPRLAFAVRLPGTAQRNIFGGLLESWQSPERLDGMLAEVTSCGTLAWLAICSRSEAVEYQTRVRHLLAERSTLKASHTEAINDAIEQREARIRQQQSYEARMNAVLRTAADGIIVTDELGIVQTFNAAAQRIFGYTAQEVIGRNVAILIPSIAEGPSKSRIYQQLESGSETANEYRGEVQGVHNDGVTCPLELAMSTARFEDQRIYTIIVRDITGRKVAEEELRRLHLQNEMILNSAGVGIFGINPDDVLIFVNPAGAKMLGWEPEELVGRRAHATLYHSARDGSPLPLATSPISMTVSGGSGCHRDPEFFWKRDGTNFPVQYTCTPIQEGGKTVGAVVTFADITQRRMLETQLAQAQKLESIGQLAAGIAHEINTPTQYIGDNIRFLRDAFADINGLVAACPRICECSMKRSGDESSPVDVDYLLEEIPAAIEQSLEGVDRVTRIVRSMKEFSHPGGDDKQSIDLNRAINSTLTVSRNEWKYVADAITDFDPTLPPVLCRPADLNQVLLNLIVNAAHAIEAKRDTGAITKGTITIRTRQDGDVVQIDVADKGEGIPESIRTKIFDPFFTTKKVGRGTGQGLAIARSIIVDRHEGTIDFQSEVGLGTTFTIRIPIDSRGLSATR